MKTADNIQSLVLKAICIGRLYFERRVPDSSILKAEISNCFKKNYNTHTHDN